jgi:hypothetical protein
MRLCRLGEDLGNMARGSGMLEARDEPGSLQRDRAIKRVRFLGNANWKRFHH